MSGNLIFQTKVRSRNNAAERTFSIFTAGSLNLNPYKLANLNNYVMKKELDGMKITQDHVEARLKADPASMLLGFLDGDFNNPLTLINVVKIVLEDADSFSDFPANQQELTGNETYSTTRPNDANTAVCPWVVVPDEVRMQGFKAEIDKRKRSLAQIHVCVVAEMAREAGRIKNVIAFTRPFNAMDYLSQKIGYGRIKFEPDPLRMTVHVWDIKTNQVFCPDKQGVCVDNDRYVFVWHDYFDARQPGNNGRLFDSVIAMHIGNGGAPVFARPNGQIYDLPSLGMRFGVIYPISTH